MVLLVRNWIHSFLISVGNMPDLIKLKFSMLLPCHRFCPVIVIRDGTERVHNLDTHVHIYLHINVHVNVLSLSARLRV